MLLLIKNSREFQEMDIYAPEIPIGIPLIPDLRNYHFGIHFTTQPKEGVGPSRETTSVSVFSKRPGLYARPTDRASGRFFFWALLFV